MLQTVLQCIGGNILPSMSLILTIPTSPYLIFTFHYLFYQYRNARVHVDICQHMQCIQRTVTITMKLFLNFCFQNALFKDLDNIAHCCLDTLYVHKWVMSGIRSLIGNKAQVSQPHIIQHNKSHQH